MAAASVRSRAALCGGCDPTPGRRDAAMLRPVTPGLLSVPTKSERADRVPDGLQSLEHTEKNVTSPSASPPRPTRSKRNETLRPTRRRQMGSGGAASADLVLNAACESCGGADELYGTACRHTTLCRSCGAAMARARGRCAVCAAPVTTLIRVHAHRSPRGFQGLCVINAAHLG
jgi:hypothetical protein